MMPETTEEMDVVGDAVAETAVDTKDLIAELGRASIAFEDEDIPYEEDILKNPTSLRSWQRYIDHKKKTKAHWKQTCQVYERALKIFERSYKLWYQYLRYRRRLIQHKSPTDVAWQHLCDAYERALAQLHKMPRIWMDYCEIMTKRRLVTETRRVFDRALRALPVTQHMRIWPLYIEFVTGHSIPETSIRVYRRYLKLNPRAREDFVDYLISIEMLDEAAKNLVMLVNEDRPVSERGKTVHQLWADLCELISKNPLAVQSVNVNAIMRQGIQKYTDQVGVLWCSFASYYIRAGRFGDARDIYEEAMVSVKTVRDFILIFDAYAQFEERNCSRIMRKLDKEAEDEDEEEDAEPKKQQLTEEEVQELEDELEHNFAQCEFLMKRRPLLLNSVLLRQNPHNVHEWLNRVKLYEDEPEKQIETFLEAVRTVDPKQQVGKLSQIWIEFAKFYEEGDQLQDARKIFEKATQAPLLKVDELASIWCEYAELELRHQDPKKANALMKRACAPPARKTHYFDEAETVQNRVYKSLRVWSLYADLEESFGTVESTRAVYDRILDLRIATPQIVINYAMFLEDHQYFEDAFKAYERGISLFRWPNVFDIWNCYLKKFIDRYGGKKLERARDLFEQCLENCPAKFTKNIFLLYAKLEENHGLSRHAMSIYNRATEAVEKDQMYDMFNIYIKKAGQLYGVAHTRPIYEHAISILPEGKSREMSMRYAQMERALGEIDRARAIYAHCSEVCDPRVHGSFWETWKDFEVKHGNEDTVREMLRIKRSVQATFNTNVNYMSAQMIAASAGATKLPGEGATAGDSMAVLEAKAQLVAEQQKSGGNISFVRGASKTVQQDTTQNPDEIDIDGDEDEDEDNREMETKAVPAAVFGNLAKNDDDE